MSREALYRPICTSSERLNSEIAASVFEGKLLSFSPNRDYGLQAFYQSRSLENRTTEPAMEPNRPDAFVLPAYVNGLALVRSLGRAGVRVIVGSGSDLNFLGSASRYADEKVKYPDPRYDPDGFQKFMREFVQEHPSLVVIPTRDDEAEQLSFLSGKLGPHVRIAVSDPATVRLCLEKQDTYRFAEEMGIPCPRTVRIGVDEHIPDRFDDFLMPCLVKPVRNCDFYMKFERRKVFVCYDGDDVGRKLDQSLKAGFDMMVQELIPGGDDTLWEYITCNGPDGRRLMEIISRKLCQNPPEFGVGCIRRSEKNDEVIDHSRRLFDKLGYCGIGETEFKYDQRDGLYKLLEINPRSVMPMSLPIKCGLDMPFALYHAYAGTHGNPIVKPMPENVYWLHGGGIMRTALNPDRTGCWRYLAMLLQAMIKPHCWAVWHWEDPLPAWRDIRGRFQR